MKTRKPKRSYVEEMAHALNQALCANHDRNPNRCAEVNGWLYWGLEVAIARRSHLPLPPRPERKFI